MKNKRILLYVCYRLYSYVETFLKSNIFSYDKENFISEQFKSLLVLYNRNFDFYRFHNFLERQKYIIQFLFCASGANIYLIDYFVEDAWMLLAFFFLSLCYLVDFVREKSDFLRAWSRVCVCIDFFWLEKSQGVVRRSSTRKNNSRKILGICVESRCQTEQQR